MFSLSINDRFKTVAKIKGREARLARRNGVKRPGWVKLDGGFAARACTVIDISDSGVRLEVTSQSAIPEKFELALSASSQSRYVCRVKWRDGKYLGAEFA